MSAFEPYRLLDVNDINFVDSAVPLLDITAAQRFRNQLLAGDMVSIQNDELHPYLYSEKAFVFADKEQSCLYWVAGVQERFRWQVISQQLELRLAQGQNTSLNKHQFVQKRVVFGLLELREKLLGVQNQLPEHMVELAKLAALNDHPYLRDKVGLQLYLDQVSTAELTFLVCNDREQERMRVIIPQRRVADAITKSALWIDQDSQVKPRQVSESLYHEYWVNLRRFNPRLSALATLYRLQHELRQGDVVSAGSFSFKIMCANLPRGNALPAWAKGALRTLQLYFSEISDAATQSVLNAIRFGAKAG